MKKTLITTSAIIALLIVIVLVRSNKEVKGETLADQLSSISELYMELKDQTNTDISKANVAWHLDHLLKVNIQISNSLINSDPLNYKSNFNPSRAFVFTTRVIPRGVAKAPESVKPPEIILTEDLYEQFEIAKAKLLSLDDLNVHSNYEHSTFGCLNRGQTIHFMEIHTNHHLKIIKDIIAN